MSLSLVTPPTDIPVSVADMKQHLRLLSSDEDAVVQGLIAAATGWLDGPNGVLGRCLVQQVWRQEFTGFCARLRLAMPDVSAVSIFYDDGQAVQAVPASEYEIVTSAGAAWIRFHDTFAWPAVAQDVAFPVWANITCGFGAPADVPAQIKLAIKMLVAMWFENREAAQPRGLDELPLSVRALISPWRTVIG